MLHDGCKLFDLLRQANLKLKSLKCSLGQKSIRLLGYIVTPAGITSDPEKVDTIRHVSIKKNAKQVRSFLGMLNFYSKLIPNYGLIVERLLHLTHKNTHLFFLGGTNKMPLND